MNLHDDIAFYTDSRVRAYDYVISSWRKAFRNFYQLSGMFGGLKTTLYIDEDQYSIDITSNYKQVFRETEYKYTGHMLEALEGFTIDINIDSCLKRKSLASDLTSYYYFSNTKQRDPSSLDAGIVETNAFFRGNFVEYEEFNSQIISATAREVQYVINKNILFTGDVKIAELDSEYECCRAYSRLQFLPFENSLEICIDKKLVSYENKEDIINLRKLINEQRNN